MAVTEYTWNPLTDSVIEETDGAGNVLVEYTNEPAPYGPLISERRGSDTRQYHFDALGSTRALTDDSQTVTDTFSYDAWGTVIAPGGDTETPALWVGRFGYLQQHVIYFVRQRVFYPTVAVWNSRDPHSTNLIFEPFSYSLNSPVSFVDPTGLVRVRFVPSPTESCAYTMKYIPPNKKGEDEPKGSTHNKRKYIWCECAKCRAQMSCRYSMECELDFEYEIWINKDSWTGVKIVPTRAQIEGTYGHEQRHVENYRTNVNMIADYLRQCERNCSPNAYRTEDECRDTAAWCVAYARLLYDFWHVLEVAHSHYPTPQHAADYPPLGTMPWPPPNIIRN